MSITLPHETTNDSVSETVTSVLGTFDRQHFEESDETILDTNKRTLNFM